MTDRIEPIDRRRGPSPVELVRLTPLEREEQRREREEQRRRRRARTASASGQGADDDAPPRLDLRA